MTKSTTRIKADIAIAGRRSLLINSEFLVNQRGITSFSGAAGQYGYLSDRWMTYANGVAISASVYSVTLPDGTVANSLKTVATTAASSFFHPYQKVETYGRDFLNGKKVVLSAWVRTTAPNQFFRLCDSVTCYALGDEIPSDGEWHKLSVVHTLRTNLNTGATDFMQFHPAFGHSALAVGDYVEFALPQMEIGSVATPFEHRSYGEELALCQRYFQHSGKNITVPDLLAIPVSTGTCTIGVDVEDGLAMAGQFPVRMRSAPTLSYGRAYSYNWGIYRTVSFLYGNANGIYRAGHDGGYSVGRSYWVTWIADAEL